MLSSQCQGSLQDHRSSKRGALADQPAGSLEALLPVSLSHFEEALEKVQASVKADDLVRYMNMPDANSFAAAATC